MPQLFNGYCYSTLAEAANAEQSMPFLTGATIIHTPASWTPIVTNPNAVTFTINKTTTGTLTLQRVYPTCSQVGYSHNITGLELQDVAITSWLVVAVFASAWGIKILRKAL